MKENPGQKPAWNETHDERQQHYLFSAEDGSNESLSVQIAR